MPKNEPSLTYLIAPNGSPDIPSQIEEFEQDGRRHFVGFQPHFHISMTSQLQFGKTMPKNESISGKYLRSLLFDWFKILQAVRT